MAIFPRSKAKSGNGESDWICDGFTRLLYCGLGDCKGTVAACGGLETVIRTLTEKRFDCTPVSLSNTLDSEGPWHF
jgi:hypothetical protein